MPGEQGQSTMTAISRIPAKGLPVFNTGGSANGIDNSRIQQAHAPRPEHSIRQPSFVPQVIRNVTPGFGNLNGYTRFIGVIKETPRNGARSSVEPSSNQALAGGYISNRFTVPITYESVHITRNGNARSTSDGKSTVSKQQIRPSVFSDFKGLSTKLKTSYEVRLPSYNFATQTFEHRTVDPTFSVKNTSKTPTQVTKPLAVEATMANIARSHPPSPEKGAGHTLSAAPQNNSGRKTTSKQRTPKKRTPQRADLLPYSRYDDSIDRVIKLACEQDDKRMGQNVQHPQRPTSATPCETAGVASTTKQRTRHRSNDLDVVPKKARKKHTKADSSKSHSEHSVSFDASHSATPITTPQTFTRRVMGQYPQRLIITKKPADAVVTSKPASIENSLSAKPPTTAISSHLGNGAPVPYQPSKASVSTPVSSYYSGAVRGHGPPVLAVDSVIPSTDPVLPDSQSAVASTTHSTIDTQADQPLDYSMKTLRRLEETKIILQPRVIDLSLPKQEATITVEKSTATTHTIPGRFYLPPVMIDAAMRTIPTQQPATSQITTSVSQPSKVAEASLLTAPIAVRYQIDTSNLDTLCDVALAATPTSAPVTANGDRKGQRNNRKRQSSQKPKKVDNSSTPKTPRKKSKSSSKKRQEKQIYIAKLDPSQPSLRTNNSSDIAPSNVDLLNQTARPADASTNSQTAKSILLTAGVDELQISDDERSDSTLDADERPDATILKNEMSVGLSKSDHLPTAPDRTSSLNCETEQKEVLTPPKEASANPEANAGSIANTMDLIPEITENRDTAAIAEKKDTVITDVKDEIDALQTEDKKPLEKQVKNVSNSDVIKTVEKASIEDCIKKIQRSACQASKTSPNVTILRLNSNEMRSNFSVLSQDGVIPIRPESLDSIMKPKKNVKTEPISQDGHARNEIQTVNTQNPVVVCARVKDDLDKPIVERICPKLGADGVEKSECSEVAAILNNSEPGGKQSSAKIKTEEVPFLPRFSCHSPIDLNEACCDEYDNMCQDFDAAGDDDCVEILQDSLQRPNVDVGTSEIAPEVQTDLNEPINESEIIFSRISAEETEDGKVAIEEISENSQAKSESLKKRKKRRRFRLTRTKKKVLTEKQITVEEASTETQLVNQEYVPEEIPAVLGGSITEQSADDPDIKPDIESTMDNSVVSSIISPTNASKDTDISPHKRKSLKLGYSLNSEFGIGDLRLKRRKLIKKDEKPIIIKPPNPPVVMNAKPICLLGSSSSESSDDESSIFKTEKAKQLVKKSHIQQKMALKESQKILKKAKDFMVKKEPNRLAKKGLLKSSGKSKCTSKPPSKSLTTTQSTPDQTTGKQATVYEEHAATPVDSNLKSPRSPYLRPNGSRYVLSRGCGPWLVTRRETQLVKGSPQKNNTELDRKCDAEKEELILSPTSEESISPKSSIRLKSFVRDPKEPDVDCKLTNEPQRQESWISTAQILNQTVTNKSLEKKLEELDEKRNCVLGFKSIVTAKTAPNMSKLKAAVPCISKLDMKASKENCDPDQVLQVRQDQSGECIVNSEACKLTVETRDDSTFPFTISPNESYGEDEEPQPFVLTTFAKDATLKHEHREPENENIDGCNSSVIPQGMDDIPEITQPVDHCGSESVNKTSQEGNPAQARNNDCTSRQISPDKPEPDSQATHNITKSVGGDAKLLSLARLLPPPPLKEECTSPPSASAKRTDVTSDIYSKSELDQNSDVTLVLPVNRVSSNANNNNIIDSLRGQISNGIEAPLKLEAVSFAKDCSSCEDNASTSGNTVTLHKNPKARIKGNWTSRDFIPAANAKRPTYFNPVRISKAKRDEKVYQIMQKMLNMGLIVDKASRKPSDMARWPSSLDKYDAGETSRSSVPSPPWPKPGKTVKREFLSEEDIIIKPCSVTIKRLDF